MMNKTLKLLAVAPPGEDLAETLEALRPFGLTSECRALPSLDELETAMVGDNWDAVLCADAPPAFDAFLVLETRNATEPELPLIVVSSESPGDRLMALTEAGASDVVSKHDPFRLALTLLRETKTTSARNRCTAARDPIYAALEGISEGFAYFDADDRLVFANRAYRESYGSAASAIVPGTRFEDIINAGLEHGLFPAAIGREQAWAARRVAHHRSCEGPFEQHVGDDQWLLIDERRTSDGGRAGFRTDITQRKKAEQALLEREELLRLMTDNMPIAVICLDRDRRYRYANRTTAEWFACSKEDIIGRTAEELLGSDSYAALEPSLDKAFEGISATFDTVVAYPDGVTRELRVSYVSSRDAQGQVNGIVGIAVDMTDRYRIERSLRDREQLISVVVENVADAVVTVDEGGRIESFNASAERIFGFSASDVVGRNVKILMPEPYRTKHDGFISSYLKTGHSGILGVGPRELVGNRKDGSTFPLELAIGEARLGERRVFIGTARDISDRVNAERAVRESEARFRGAFETAPHGMALVAPDGRLLKVNQALCELLDYSPDELLEKDFQSITHPDDLEIDLDYVKRALAGEISTYQMEKRYICRGGEIVTILLSVSIIRDTQGKPLYFVSQILDLTKRKETEAQLLQAQKMEAIGQLTGGVAHDFNNLLTIILGNVRLLERRLAADPSAAKQLTAVAGASKRGAELTQRLLAVSRRETLDPEAVDGRTLIGGTLDMLRRTLGEMIEVRASFADDLHYVFADPGQLETALLNLANNARDAMPRGGTLSIEMSNVVVDESFAHPQSKLDTGNYVLLSVSDTGVGIPSDELDRVFEPFYTTKEVGKGTGLGLSIVFGFVNQSGGHVRVESTVGAGTTFLVYLPAAESRQAIVAQTAESAAVPVVGGKTILVVEDEPGVRDIAVTPLTDLGYRVIEAENGPHALSQLERHRDIDLIFTDVVMPGGLTGFELAEKVGELRPSVKVVFATGYADDALAGRDAFPDIDWILAKPYEEAELAAKIHAALAGTARTALPA